MQKYGFFDMASWAVSAFGAMFLGAHAFGWDPFRDYFGRNSNAEKMLYGTFGLAGLMSLFQFFSWFRLPETMRDTFNDVTNRTLNRTM